MKSRYHRDERQKTAFAETVYFGHPKDSDYELRAAAQDRFSLLFSEPRNIQYNSTEEENYGPGINYLGYRDTDGDTEGKDIERGAVAASRRQASIIADSSL